MTVKYIGLESLTQSTDNIQSIYVHVTGFVNSGINCVH